MRVIYNVLLLLVVSVCFMCSTVARVCAEESIKIAVIMAQTGAPMQSDLYGWEAAQLAVEQLNLQGGILGRPVEVLLFDTQGTPIGASKAAQEAARHNVVGVVGAIWSSQTLAIASVMQKAGIPMITPSSTHPDVTGVGSYIFRTVFTDTQQGGALARFAYDDLQAATAVVLRNVSETYSVNLAEKFVSSFTESGGEIVWQGDYKTNTSDFTRILQKVQSVAPQIVFVPGYERDCAILLRQAGSLGVNVRFLGGDGWARSILEVAGAAANGSFYLAQWHPDSPEPVSRRVVELFTELHPEQPYPPMIFPMTYSAISLLADAIQRAGVLDTRAIQKALSETEAFETATGAITFDANGDPIVSSATIVQIIDNDIQFYKKIRFP